MLNRLVNSKFKKDVLVSYFTQFYTVLMGFFQLFLINKYFGIEVFGQLSVIIATAGIFSSLLTARSSEAVTRFLKREFLKNNLKNVKFVLYIGFFIDFVTAIFLLLIIYLLSDKIAYYFLKNNNLNYEVFLYSFVTFFLFIRGTVMGYLLSKEMIFHIKMMEIIESSMKIILLIMCIYLFNFISLRNLIYIMIFSSFISLLYAYYIFFNSYIKALRNIKVNFNKNILKEYWNFNLKTFFSSSLKAGNQNLDNLMLGYFLNTEIVGLYQVLKKIASPILIIASPFSLIVYPKLIKYFETNQKNKFIDIILKISFYILVMSVVYSLITYLFLDNILKFMSININSLQYNVNLYYLFVLFLHILIAEMWWVRIFSNTVNPNYSIIMNLFATFYQLSITIIATKIFGLIGLLFSIMIMNFLILIFWLKKGYKYVYTYIHT